MKILNLILVSAVLLLLFNTTYAIKKDPADVEAVKQVIQNYVKGTDSRNIDAIEQTLYTSGNYYSYNTFTKKISQMTNEQFIDKVKKERPADGKEN